MYITYNYRERKLYSYIVRLFVINWLFFDSKSGYSKLHMFLFIFFRW